MRLVYSNFIYVFLVITGLVLFYFWAFKARKRIEEKFAQKELLVELSSGIDYPKRLWKVLLVILGVSFSLLALMRPQWGFHWEEVKRKGIDIIIALDTSRSMLAQDVLPSRLERSKLAIGDFALHLKGDRVGLVAFAGKAFMQCPLTVDYNGFLISLESINTDIIPRGGTSLSRAIREVIKGYAGGRKPEGSGKYKTLVIITDGEDHEGDALDAAQEAKKEGIVIFCIGIGTKEGDLVSVVREDGTKEFLKGRDGNVIKSRLDETTLQKIALATGGSYIHSQSAEFGLDLLYKERLSKMEKRDLESKMSKHYEERFQIPLLLGFLLLLMEPFLSDKK